MVYCDPDMCESKLGKLMQAFRADRPDEWTMDDFIRMAEEMHKTNRELLAALEFVIEDKAPSYHDCTDNGEPECGWCVATAAVKKAKNT